MTNDTTLILCNSIISVISILIMIKGKVSAHVSSEEILLTFIHSFIHAHLSSIDIVKDKVKLLCRLKRVMEPNQEWMLEAFQEHISLSHDVLLLTKTKKKPVRI